MFLKSKLHRFSVSNVIIIIIILLTLQATTRPVVGYFEQRTHLIIKIEENHPLAGIYLRDVPVVVDDLGVGLHSGITHRLFAGLGSVPLAIVV